MKEKVSNLLFIAVLTLVPTLFIWFPFFLRLESVWGIPLPKDGMATVVANYDGPLFIATAKSLYDPEILNTFEFDLPVEYFAAHFPLYPILIRLLGGVTGYPYAMLIITLLSSFLAIFYFSKLIGDYVSKKDIGWMTAVFALFPARWLIVRSVGSPEPLFLAAIIASLYYFRKEKYLLAGIWGLFAQLTKSPGILLFIAYLMYFLVPKIKLAALAGTFKKWIQTINFKHLLSILLIPLGLLGIFVLYKFQLNDFFAYFHSGDNIHLFFPPFQIFNYSEPWVGTFWLEEVIFIYLFGILGLIKLIKMKENQLAWFVGIFFTSILFVSHRDLMRYSLPIVPFLLIAFSDTIIKKEFKIAMLVLIIPIYLFSLVYISQNVMPISDWAPIL